MFRKKFKKWAEESLSQYSEKEIIEVTSNSNFFGQKSKGIKQIRGNGVLILTEEEIYFKLYLPKKEFRIPITSISDIQIAHSHLGKKISHPLLKVLFINDSGSADSIAWYVPNLEKWQKSMLALLHKIKK